MLNTKLNQFAKLLAFVFFLTGSAVMAQTHKLEKDGKFKNKKSHSADHHQKHESKKKHHKEEWKHHTQMENDGFSKKKRKKK